MSRRSPDEGASAWLAALLVLTGVGLWWLVRHPRFTGPLVAVVVSVWRLGPTTTGRLGLLVLVAPVVWQWRDRPSFDRFLGLRLRASWRRWWVYRRRWQATMSLSKLAKRFDGGEVTPRLRRVWSDHIGDVVEVRMRPAQSLDDWELQLQRLASSFGALSCRLLDSRPGWLWLEFKVRDVLAEVVPALPVPDRADLRHVAIGVAEDGSLFRIRLLAAHLFLAGATGAGKSSALHALLRGVAPAIRDRVVIVWAIDPKAGMELAFAAPLFDRFAYELDDMLQALRDAVAFMQQRAGRLRFVTRLHHPSVEDPLLVLIVDEIAALTQVLGTRKQREEADELLRLLMQQGRSVGVVVVGAVQDPSKDGVPYRNLFTTRIAFRLNEPTEADMVLGKGARDRGAVCDRISDTSNGVGYAVREGRSAITMLRVGYPTDDDIKTLAQRYTPNPHPDAIDAEVIELHPDQEGVPA